jgi:Uma2 family endonuclease
MKTAALAEKKQIVPPLESGDRLTRAEFERRYQALPHVKKAELVEGVVYMPSPTRFLEHSQPHGQLMTWLGTYVAATPFVAFGDNATVRLDADNEPQPDALLRIASEAGGRSHVDEDGYVSGPPELIAEIASTSAAYDLHDKMHAYRRNGVAEYLVWLVYDRRIAWFHLREGRYEPLAPDDEGIIASRTFPGLQLNVTMLLAGDLAGVLQTLQGGLATQEHEAFVARLAEKAEQEGRHA